MSSILTQEGTLIGKIYPQLNIYGRITYGAGSTPETEEKIIVLESIPQVIEPSEGKLLSRVTVNGVPSNYGLITYNGFEITVS